MSWIRSSLFTAFLVAPLFAQEGPLAQESGMPLRRAAPWDAAVVARFGELPVQDGGRVKPFLTVAQFAMLRINGRRSMTVPDEPSFGAIRKERLGPVEWALDVLFYPRMASEYPCFLVENREALQAVGLTDVAGRKRDRYSYVELRPGISRLGELYESYRGIEEKHRTPVQSQIMRLGNSLIEYQGLQGTLDFARETFVVDAAEATRTAFGGAERAPFSVVVARADALAKAHNALEQARDRGRFETEPELRDEFQAVNDLLSKSVVAAQRSSQLDWLPADDPGIEEWRDPFSLYVAVRQDGSGPNRGALELVARAEAAVDALGGPEFTSAVDKWVGVGQRLASARGEKEQIVALSPLWSTVLIFGGILGVYLSLRRRVPARIVVGVLSALVVATLLFEITVDKLALEVTYLNADFFYRSLVVFVLGFVLLAVSWFKPNSRRLGIATNLTALVATLILIAGLVARCVLRERPPVTTLYETILFITAIVASTGLLIESINRRKVAISIAMVVGAIGMFLAAKFEAIDRKDTMPQLVAVLDTNFWLSTHVITVTLGYGAALLAGFLAHVFLVGKLFRFRAGDRAFYRAIGRMVYGVICFGLVFSTVGTILGGVWANYSWGRFWGWDPKENGALLIVLWELMILHGRLGNLWRDFGICLLAVLGNIVVAFSWWGVNLMGVGLHSYGFTSQLKTAVMIFNISQLTVFALGCVAWYVQRQRELARAEARNELADAAPEPPPAG